MALSKAKTLDNGASGDYWRLTQVWFDRETLRVVARIALYTSMSVANASNRHLGYVKTFSFDITSMELMGDIRALVYTKIKDKASEVVTTDIFGHDITPTVFDPDLSGATDV